MFSGMVRNSYKPTLFGLLAIEIYKADLSEYYFYKGESLMLPKNRWARLTGPSEKRTGKPGGVLPSVILTLREGLCCLALAWSISFVLVPAVVRGNLFLQVVIHP